MDKRIKYTVGVVCIIIVIILGMRIFSGNEDTWICTDAGWVKHGNPAIQTPPNTVCQIK